MKRLLLVKILTILIIGLMSGWLMMSRPNLPSLPKDAEKGQLINDFKYGSKTPQSAIDVILSRPLFLSSRRPYVPTLDSLIPDIKDIKLALPSLDHITLFGITISPDNRAGLVKKAGDAKTSTVHEGEVLDGWRVEHIQRNSIIFSNGNDRRELFLYKRQNSSVVQ